MKKTTFGILAAALALAIAAPVGARQLLTVAKSQKQGETTTQGSVGAMLRTPTINGRADVKMAAESPEEKPLDVVSMATAAPKLLPGDTYYNDFSDGAEKMLVIDVNEDGKTWVPSNGAMRVAYNSSLDMDDWMITEGIQLEAGKMYEVSADGWAQSGSYPEKFEIKAGTARTVAGMTTEVIPVSTFKGTEPEKVVGMFIPQTSGTYYIGVHACSVKDTYYVYCDNLRVGPAMSAGVPAKVADLTVEPQGADGIATVKCTVPTTNMTGGSVGSITKIEFWRDVTPIKTIENPTPGQSISFVDECGAGKYTWKVVATNAEGSGPEATFTITVVGPKGIPWLKTFPTASSMDEMGILDANGDGSTWKWNQYQKYAELSCAQGGDNDWLFTPPLILKAGKVYEWSSLVSAGNPTAYPPMLRVCIGKAQTAEAMTQEILPKFTITQYDTYLKEEFSVPTDGLYYLGVHGCSEKWLALIKLMNINVIGGAEIDGPAKVTDAVLEPDWSGRTKNAYITFKAPTKTGAGDNLTAMTKIDIMRNGIVVKTFDNPTPGSEYSYVDPVGSAGNFVYRIVPYNTVGQGGVVEETVAIGVEGKPVTYLEDFRNADRFDNELYFIDNNNDGTNFWHATMTTPPYAWCHYDGKATSSADDYLITPGISLQAGSTYRISADAWGHNEGFRLLVGTAPKLDSLKNTIVPLTTLTEFLTNFSGEFTPPYSGKFYVAAHDFTPAGSRMQDFHVTNIKVEKVGTLTAPAKVDNFTVIADPNGEAKLTFKFNAPTKNFDGSALDSVSKIEIKRKGTVVKTFENPTPGQALEYVDEPGAVGEYTYVITPFGKGNSEGAPIEYLGYAGRDLPATPQNVVATPLAGGKVRITWDPVTTTAHGAQISYNPIFVILESDGLAENQLGQTTQNFYEYKALPDGEIQHHFNYYIYPFNNAPEPDHGEYGISNDCFVGEPFTLAYLESFENGAPKTPFVIKNRVFSPAWSLCTDESFTNVVAADGDNGFLAQKGYINNIGIFYTGIIDLANTVSPTFSFYADNLNPTDYTNEVSVEICEAGTDNWTVLYTKPIREAVPSIGWGRISVDLSAWKGKKVHVGIVPKVNYCDESNSTYYGWSIFDGFRVHNLTNKDLGATISVSETSVDAGGDIDVTVTVTNNGETTAASYRVDLYKNNEVIDQLNGSNLGAGKVEKLLFPIDFNVADQDTVSLYAKVVFEGDENMLDNTSKTVTVNVNKPIYPVVNNLQAVDRRNGKIELTWDAPDMTKVPTAPYKETFESATAPSFSGACGWTFVDVDGLGIGGFQQFNFPQLTSDGNSKASFFVVDQTSSELGAYGSLFAGNGGSNKSIGSLLGWSALPDDWAISPELYGGPQTVSFFGKNLQDNMPDKVELWYSTGSTNPSDFVFVKEWSFTSAAWTECSAFIPNGAKRVAFRHNYSGGIVQIDDVTIRRAGDSAETITLKGYNVYRNGEKVNDDLVTGKTFTETGVPTGMQNYAVNAVYDKGQSDVTRVSVNSLFVNGMNDVNATVIGGNGIIEVLNGAYNQVTVTGMDGNIIYSAKAQGNLKIRAEKGVYVVKVGGKAFKVVVK